MSVYVFSLDLRLFLLTPLREGRRLRAADRQQVSNISTHAPAGGATWPVPLGRKKRSHFYSRPCGRGDPLRWHGNSPRHKISTHAPAGGATEGARAYVVFDFKFLLTPLREGRPRCSTYSTSRIYFYSRPCGRGDAEALFMAPGEVFISTHAPAGGATRRRAYYRHGAHISTHAPAGGATAIFHKSVMRFCGKLPKDDTVLCLASFGFPRRDPKAVYLAWISCANLPQKCVRQGLALKDQGTSCFHVGLASHAFDPVLV